MNSKLSDSNGKNQLHSQTLMVIDDDPDTQDVVIGFFRPRGYQVITFDDAEHALKAIEEKGNVPDVILTDLRLPQMTGIEFTERVKKAGVTAPLILMTAHKSVEIAVSAIEAGAYDFIVKPIHFPQLLVSVERAVHLNKIRVENQALKIAAKGKSRGELDGIIGRSPGLLRALDLAKRVSNSAASVYVSGESGTGKEVIARAIHNFGNRRDKPFVAINCSAIPENLLESELFGYAKGAFTGASDKKIGLFEEAQGGTLFLDEIGDLSLPLQAKLLRVLQERKIKRIGENQVRPIDVRVVSATHKDLTSEVNEKRFREDLFFRLNVIPIALPPLRERREDIIPLAEFFLAKYAALNGSSVQGFTKDAIEKLYHHFWRGNVRELENTIERATVLCQRDLIDKDDLFGELEPKPEKVQTLDAPLPLAEDGTLLTLQELTDAYVLFALDRNGGAKDKTARDLGIDRKTLYRRLQMANLPPTGADRSPTVSFN